jgi:hypothetical protein
MYLQAYLLKLDPEQYTPPNFIGFSAQTSANMTQGLIDAKLDKRRKVSSETSCAVRCVVCCVQFAAFCCHG